MLCIELKLMKPYNETHTFVIVNFREYCDQHKGYLGTQLGLSRMNGFV